MRSTSLLLIAVALALVLPIASLFFGSSCGGGCGGCGGYGRKKRSVEELEEYRFEADHNDKLCNNPELKRFIDKNMVTNPLASKTNLVTGLQQEGDRFFVVCTTGDSAYSAPRSSVFCSSTAHNHTCYVLGF
ncbi:unnamed protein product [Nippostrongylus brasiliensis]|uniref:Ground-like domain-containing protein n=1 Tax=Nippostrongylus brasiliensis TaxID=27835 RepID=A0A158R1A1_NIPBR|nr:unnamed protein product [Nippostrongylus brasiliensis]